MTIAFLFLGAVALAASVLVVVSRRIVHSALYLIVSFLALAGIFIILGAEFIAAVQILVYAGSIVVMFVFVVMTVGFRETSSRSRSAGWWIVGFVIGLTVLGELAASLYFLSPYEGAAGKLMSPPIDVTREMGRLIFSEWILPLEVFSLVILAVLVGIAVLRREGRRVQ